jgi:hypothetical protein
MDENVQKNYEKETTLSHFCFFCIFSHQKRDRVHNSREQKQERDKRVYENGQGKKY